MARTILLTFGGDPPDPPAEDGLLAEDGSQLQTEGGDDIILE
jgi:hypothetical protein